ncbi:MAG: hypothetical protein ACXWCM_18620 [Acidimicrobiales bacterium]
MGNETVRVARNTFYASVGFGVLAFQKVQVRRRELEKALKPPVEALQRQLRTVAGHASHDGGTDGPTDGPTDSPTNGGTSPLTNHDSAG